MEIYPGPWQFGERRLSKLERLAKALLEIRSSMRSEAGACRVCGERVEADKTECLACFDARAY